MISLQHYRVVTGLYSVDFLFLERLNLTVPIQIQKWMFTMWTITSGLVEWIEIDSWMCLLVDQPSFFKSYSRLGRFSGNQTTAICEAGYNGLEALLSSRQQQSTERRVLVENVTDVVKMLAHQCVGLQSMASVVSMLWCVVIEGRHLLLSDHGLVLVDVLTDDSVTDRVFRHIMDLWYELFIKLECFIVCSLSCAQCAHFQ